MMPHVFLITTGRKERLDVVRRGLLGCRVTELVEDPAVDMEAPKRAIHPGGVKCTRKHMAALRAILDSGEDGVIVEDNVEFTEPLVHSMGIWQTDLQSIDWDLVFNSTICDFPSVQDGDVQRGSVVVKQGKQDRYSRGANCVWVRHTPRLAYFVREFAKFHNVSDFNYTAAGKALPSWTAVWTVEPTAVYRKLPSQCR